MNTERLGQRNCASPHSASLVCECVALTSVIGHDGFRRCPMSDSSEGALTNERLLSPPSPTTQWENPTDPVFN